MAKKKKTSRSKKNSSKKDSSLSVTVMDLKSSPAITNLIWIDAVHIQTRQDGFVSLIFETAIADHGCRLEACRVAMSTEQAKRVVELLASQLNHFPMKAEA